MKKGCADKLDKDLITFYRENGYCTLLDILDRDECQRYLGEAEKIARDQTVQYDPVMNPDRIYPAFAELLAHESIVRCLETLQNSRIWGLQSMLYYRPPGSLGRDLHQDIFYSKTEIGAYIGTWLPLEDTDRENGGLVAYPGSHREPVLEVIEDKTRKQTNFGEFKNDRGLACKVPEGYPKVYLEVPAGACVLIHSNLIHGSEENYSQTRFRRVFAGHYIKEGYSFLPGQHAKRQAIDLYSSKGRSL